jgi:two-component sensor histidine kinase
MFKFVLTTSFILLLGFSLDAQELQDKRLSFGVQLYNTGRFIEADKALDALVIHCAKCSDGTIATAYIYLGKTQQYLDDAKKAMLCYRRGNIYASKTKDVNLQFWTDVSMVEFYRWKNNLPKAIEILKKIEGQLINPDLSLKNKAYYYNRLGAVLVEDKSKYQLDSIVVIHNLALEIALTSKDTVMLTTILTDLGYCYEHQENTAEAEKKYLEALQLYQIINNRRGIADVCSNLSRLFLSSNLNKAEKYADLGIESCKGEDWNQPLYFLYSIKVSLAINSKNYISAIAYTKLYQQYYHLHIQQVYAMSLAEMEQRLALKDKELQIDKQLVKQVLLEDTLELERVKKEKNKILFISSMLVIIVLLTSIAFLRKQLKEKKGLLKTKEYLVQEIHHRVKNNLQTLNSILYLQKQNAKTSEHKQWVIDMQSRLEAISTAHQSLQDNVLSDKQNVNEYVHRLMENISGILSSYGSLDYTLDIQSISLSVDKISALGMIINELYNNTIEHTHLNEQSKAVLVLRRIDEKHILFSYEQFAIETANPKNENMGLGLQIISAIGKQLGEIIPNEGFQQFQLIIKL